MPSSKTGWRSLMSGAAARHAPAPGNDDEHRPVREVPTVCPDRPPRPQVAVARDHASARLVQRRPARRQPGADRADGRRAQAADVPAAREDGVQGDRDRLPGGVADRLRLRPQAHRGRPHSRGRERAGADAGARAADRAHVRGGEGRAPRDHAPVQLDVDHAAPRRVRPGPRRHQADRRGRRARRARLRAGAARHRVDVPVLARELHGDRARLREGSLRRRARRLAADAAAQGDHQPAGHRRDGHAERLRRPGRVDEPQPRAPRQRRAVGAPAQRPRLRRGRGRARA